MPFDNMNTACEKLDMKIVLLKEVVEETKMFSNGFKKKAFWDGLNWTNAHENKQSNEVQ